MAIQPTPVIALKDRPAIGNPFARLQRGSFLDVKGMSAVDAAQRMGMDFEVRKFPLDARLPTGGYMKTPSYGIFSNRGGDWIHTSTAKKGENLEIVQNMDIAKVLDAGDGELSVPLTKQFEMFSAGNLGRFSFFCLEMGGDSVKLNGTKDEYVTYMVVGNDYAKLRSFWSQGYTAVRCINTLLANLGESDAEKTLWNMSFHSAPLSVLAFRADLEHSLQETRKSFYRELGEWGKYIWNEDEKERFVKETFPIPSVPKSVHREQYAPHVRPELALPIVEKAKNDRDTYDARVETAEGNRMALRNEIAFWADELHQDSLYTGYAAGTSVITWRHERGSMDDLAEAVVFNTRRQDMDRMMQIGRLLIASKN